MDKNIQMTQRNAANTAWDNIFPKTKAANVTTAGGSDVETALADITNNQLPLKAAQSELDKLKYRIYMGV